MRGRGGLPDEQWSEIRREVESRGEAQLRLEPYHGEGGLAGVDLGAALERPELAALLCEVAFDLARAHDLEVFDPQLGRLVHRGDGEEIQRQARLGSAFSEAAPLTATPAAVGSSASLRLWLIIGGACLVALLAARALTCAV